MRKHYLLFGLLTGYVPVLYVQASPDSLANYLKTHAPVDTAYVRAMDPVIVDMIYKKSAYARADSMSKQMIACRRS